MNYLCDARYCDVIVSERDGWRGVAHSPEANAVHHTITLHACSHEHLSDAVRQASDELARLGDADVSGEPLLPLPHRVHLVVRGRVHGVVLLDVNAPLDSDEMAPRTFIFDGPGDEPEALFAYIERAGEVS